MDEKDQLRDIKSAFKWIDENLGTTHLITIQDFIYWQNAKIEQLTSQLNKCNKRNDKDKQKLQDQMLKITNKLNSKIKELRSK